MAGEGQSSFIKGLGDGLYPPLWIKSFDNKINLVAKYIILDSYSEKYTPKLNIEYVYGKLNPKVTYSTTERHIDISFQLAARNVHEAKVNLDYCQLLARSVYGVYDRKNPLTGKNHPFTEQGGRAIYKYEFKTQRTYLINFGTFLRSQPAKILNFDFSINFDAGVFDYGSTQMSSISALLGYGEGKEAIGKTQDTQWWSQGKQPSSTLSEQEYVYHANRGKVLPKLINVTLSMLATHTKPNVCFGGPSRHGGAGWSLTENLDWPHGTGPIPSALYCRKDTGVKHPDLQKSDAEPVIEEVSPTEVSTPDIDVVDSEGSQQALKARLNSLDPDQ